MVTKQPLVSRPPRVDAHDVQMVGEGNRRVQPAEEKPTNHSRIDWLVSKGADVGHVVFAAVDVMHGRHHIDDRLGFEAGDGRASDVLER
jgi:hypothetical protein